MHMRVLIDTLSVVSRKRTRKKNIKISQLRVYFRYSFVICDGLEGGEIYLKKSDLIEYDAD